MAKTDECRIEVGDSVHQPYDGYKPLHTGKWWWNIHASRFTIESKWPPCGSKRSAVRAARRVAKRCRLQVVEVHEQE